MDHAALGVDTQNPNGALNLYESVGFRVEKAIPSTGRSFNRLVISRLWYTIRH